MHTLGTQPSCSNAIATRSLIAQRNSAPCSLIRVDEIHEDADLGVPMDAAKRLHDRAAQLPVLETSCVVVGEADRLRECPRRNRPGWLGVIGRRASPTGSGDPARCVRCLEVRTYLSTVGSRSWALVHVATVPGEPPRMVQAGWRAAQRPPGTALWEDRGDHTSAASICRVRTSRIVACAAAYALTLAFPL